MAAAPSEPMVRSRHQRACGAASEMTAPRPEAFDYRSDDPLPPGEAAKVEPRVLLIDERRQRRR
jgi:hypothetical protein